MASKFLKLPWQNSKLIEFSGELPLDQAPGMGIVLPGGLNAYYLDIAPNTEGALVSLCAI